MNSHLDFYIDGAWVASDGGRRHQVIDPATEQPVTEITLGSAADVDRAVGAARRAFDSFAQTTPEDRAALLDRIVALYQARIPDLARAISAEMGAPIGFAQAAQVPAGLGHLYATAQALRAFPFSERVGKARVVHEPVGVVALITPWNWPLNQICAKVAPALAGGNTMILKPSEEAPSCAMILAEILHEAGVPAGVFNLVNGDGPTVGAALSRHPDVDMVSFTGSTRAGIEVARAAAPTVKRVHQELGGKSANILLPDADIAAAAAAGLRAVVSNAGQSCNAPTRMLVPNERRDEAIAALADAAATIRIGDPTTNPDIGPVVSRSQFDRIQHLIEAGIAEGATLVAGGPGRPEGLDMGFFVQPTVFADVTNDMVVAREEIFGPVLSVIGYDTVDEAITIANDTPYGLAGYIQGTDEALIAEVASRLRVGQVLINQPHPDGMAPFGGYKQSGNGREWGDFGFEAFLEVKAVLGAKPVSPPRDQPEPATVLA